MHLNVRELFDNYLNTIRRLLPQPSQPPIAGIDIGTSTVKAVIVSGVNGSAEISTWALEPILSGDVKAALTNLLLKIQFKDHIAVASVSGKGTLIRYIDMPRMPLEDLRKAFIYDLDKYFPFDPQSIYTDCFILDQGSKDKRMSVLVAAVKKEIVDERVKLFKDVGVNLAHVTINSIATTNLFDHLQIAQTSPSEHAKAILDIGGAVSTLIVIKDRSPRFTRDIFIGSHEMTKQIVNILGMDPFDAEALKCAPGQKVDEVMDACEAAVSNLVGEIRLSLDYFMTEKNIQIDEFLLLGGGSLLKGIEGVFEKNLGMPVKTWDPLNGMRLSPTVAASDIRKYSAQLGVAVGLGLTKI